MPRRLLLALPLLLLAAALLGAAPAQTEPEPRAVVAPCADLDTAQVGVGRGQVRIGNVADVTGPVPGLFLAAQQAVEAYVARFNARWDLCGRRVVLDTHDSRTDAAREQVAYAAVCEQDLAAVGSMSAFDGGGARTAEECGLPDLRAETVTAARRGCSTCLAVHPTRPGVVGRAVPRHLAEVEPGPVEHAAILYVDDEQHRADALAAVQAATDEGWNLVYVQAIPPGDMVYLPYAQQVEATGTRLVQFLGPASATVRLQEAMRQWGYVPELFLQDGEVYTPAYVRQAGEDAEGVLTHLPHVLLGERGSTELARYRRWLERVHPGARPEPIGLWAWSAARLLLAEARALRGDLTRERLLVALRDVEGWTAGDLHAPQPVGAQRESRCELLARRTDGAWRQVSAGFLCAPLARQP